MKPSNRLQKNDANLSNPNLPEDTRRPCKTQDELENSHIKTEVFDRKGSEAGKGDRDRHRYGRRCRYRGVYGDRD